MVIRIEVVGVMMIVMILWILWIFMMVISMLMIIKVWFVRMMIMLKKVIRIVLLPGQMPEWRGQWAEKKSSCLSVVQNSGSSTSCCLPDKKQCPDWILHCIDSAAVSLSVHTSHIQCTGTAAGYSSVHMHSVWIVLQYIAQYTCYTVWRYYCCIFLHTPKQCTDSPPIHHREYIDLLYIP